MHFANSDSVERSRFYAAIDIMAYFGASAIIIGLAGRIENILDERPQFNYLGLIFLFASFAASYVFIYLRIGNLGRWGLSCLALSTLLGVLVFFGGLFAVIYALHSTTAIFSIGAGEFVFFFGALYCFIFMVVVSVRLLSFSAAWVTRSLFNRNSVP